MNDDGLIGYVRPWGTALLVPLPLPSDNGKTRPSSTAAAMDSEGWRARPLPVVRCDHRSSTRPSSTTATMDNEGGLRDRFPLSDATTALAHGRVESLSVVPM